MMCEFEEKYKKAQRLFRRIFYVITPCILRITKFQGSVYTIECEYRCYEVPELTGVKEKWYLSLDEIEMINETMKDSCSDHSREQWEKILEKAREMAKGTNTSK